MATKKSEDEVTLHDDTETYGTGETIKETAPQDEVPDKLLTEDGAVIDLDHGTINRKPEILDLCGRKVDLTEFGHDGEAFIHLLYEQYLFAVQNDQKTTFTEYDIDLVNSYNILKHIPQQYDRMKQKIVWRSDEHAKTVGVMLWDQNTTFLEWMVFTLATLRWRYEEEIEGRRITHALKQEEIDSVRDMIGECISAVEKWLAMPEAKRLTSV